MSDYNNRPDQVLAKKLSDYNNKLINFVAGQELTVTITLEEYRDLVGKVATRTNAIDAANADKYAREQAIKSKDEEIAKLKAENYELQKRINELLITSEADDNDPDPFNS